MFRIVQDPVYGTSIYLNGEIPVRLVDSPPFQRMRRIKQLGYTSLVYPSATHSRFEHMLGTWHLASRATNQMLARGDLTKDDEEAITLARLAALCHDLGHANATHILEAQGVEWADHERHGERWITEGSIGEILADLDIPDAAAKISEIIRHEGDNPLRALIAGPVDVDGLDYMRRDAFYCFGPNMSGFNQDRLLDAMSLHRDASGVRTLVLHEKALHALEELIFQRYSLYRNVYWHRVVRAASIMASAMIHHAIEGGIATVEEFQTWHDEQVFHVLQERVACVVGEAASKVRRLAVRLWGRDLYTSALELPIGAIPTLSPAVHRRVEFEISRLLGLESGEVLLDNPHKVGMYEREVQILRKDGSLVSSRDLGSDDGFIMNGLSHDLHQASGKCRVFTAEPRRIREADLMRIVQAEL